MRTVEVTAPDTASGVVGDSAIRLPWAKFPTKWLPSSRGDGDAGDISYPLHDMFGWKQRRTTATAALVLLMLLAIRLNQSKVRRDFVPVNETGTLVSVTYDDMQAATGFARSTISKALRLLVSVNAIAIHSVARTSVYALLGVDEIGGWCQLPQGQLLRGGRERMPCFDTHPYHRTKTGLNAIKLYVLLLARRSQRLNLTIIGYDAIEKQTGIQRSHIYQAFQMLVVSELITVAPEEDAGDLEQTRSGRYRIRGLQRMP